MREEELAHRLARCERSLRRLRLGTACLLVGGGALVAAGVAPQPPSEVRARSVTVVDAAGRPLLELGGDSGAGRLVVKGPNGATAAEILVTPSGGRSVVFDERGRVAVAAGCDRNGGTFSVANRNASLVVTAKADESGSGAIGAWSGQGGGGRLLGPTGVREPEREEDAD